MVESRQIQTPDSKRLLSHAGSFGAGAILTGLAAFALRPSSPESTNLTLETVGPSVAPPPTVVQAAELTAPPLPSDDFRTPLDPEVVELSCDHPNASTLAAKAFHDAAFWLSCTGLARPEAEFGELRRALRPPRPAVDPQELQLQKEIGLKIAIAQVGDVSRAAAPLVAAAKSGQLGEPYSTCFRPGNEAQDHSVWFGLNTDNQGQRVPVISIGEKGQFKDYLVPETNEGKAYALQMLKSLALEGTTKGPEVDAWYKLIQNIELAQQK